MLEPEDEARRLAALFAGNPAGLLGILTAQLSVLKTQAQIFMGLATITITVTGFSGHNMVRGGIASTTAMLLGVGLVLAGIVLTLRALRQLRWVTQDLADDLAVTALAAIRRRDREQRTLGGAGALIASGVGAYLVAVVLAALANGRFTPP
jgi:hypothetical protein